MSLARVLQHPDQRAPSNWIALTIRKRKAEARTGSGLQCMHIVCDRIPPVADRLYAAMLLRYTSDAPQFVMEQ